VAKDGSKGGSKGKKGEKEKVVTVVKRQAAQECHVKLLGLCI